MTRLRIALWAALTLTGVLAPIGAERAAVAALGTPCQGTRCVRMDGATLDANGLRLTGIRGRLGPMAFEGDLARATLGDEGLLIEVEGLAASAEVSRPKQAPASPESPAPSPAPGRANAASPRDPLARLDGIPLTVRTRGRVKLAAGDLRAELRDFTGHRDASGTMEATGIVEAQARGVRIASDGPLRIRPWEEGAEIRGRLRVGDAQATKLLARAKPGAVRAVLVPAEGGRAEVDVALTGLRPTSAELRAEDLALDALQDYTRWLPDGLAVSLHTTRLDGHVTLRDRTGTGLRTVEVGLADATLRGLSLQSTTLAREPVNLRPLDLDGRLVLSRAGIETDLMVGHGELAAKIEGSFAPAAADLRVDLRPISCQSLLESMPEGFLPMLRGMEMDGEVDGGLLVRYDREQVVRYVDQVADYGEYEPPGRLELRLPVLEACTVRQDPAEIDFDALRGPYRHRYLTDAGTERQLLLAPGSPGFVSLEEVGLIADAFTTLEDGRFWEHDGFDREQMERAFWYNLAQGRVRRGASTITQQIARNLWLGIDRSISRKLQEAILAWRMEQVLDKRRILELYLNVIELGPEVHGVADAARYHFGRDVRKLRPLQAVHLASMAPGPRLYSQRFAAGTVDREWRSELREQVRRMYVHKHISSRQLKKALRSPLRLVDHQGA